MANGITIINLRNLEYEEKHGFFQPLVIVCEGNVKDRVIDHVEEYLVYTMKKSDDALVRELAEKYLKAYGVVVLTALHEHEIDYSGFERGSE